MKLVECDQYSERWWSARKGVPTASEFHNIITPSKGDYSKSAENYACALIAERYDHYYGQPSEFATAAMKNGSIMEPEARRFYEFYAGAEVQQVGFCLTDDGRFGASPDALVGDCGVLELKNPTAEMHIRYLIDGGLPEKFKPQLHGQLIVTGREWADLMSYYPGLPPLLIRVTPDEYTKKLRVALDTFWAKYQELLQKIERGRQKAIEQAIDRQGELDDSLRSFVLPHNGDAA